MTVPVTGGTAALLALLPENLAVHAGRTPAELGRIRGCVLAAFERTGLPEEALPYVVESLESGDLAVEIAGAATGLRGLPAPRPSLLPALLTALRHAAGIDETVTLEQPEPRWPFTRPTTAGAEILCTLRSFGSLPAAVGPELEALVRDPGRLTAEVVEQLRELVARLDQAIPPAPRAVAAPMPVSLGHYRPTELMLEDQDGRRATFEECFSGRPTVLAFFYTRCDNPYKCTVTVTRLAALQRLIAQQSAALQIAAITYDPEFDLPDRLRRYGEQRGIRFGPHARFFRAVAGFADLRHRLDLGVGYGPSTVNRHQVELYLLDAHAAVRSSFTRTQWDVETVYEAATRLTTGSRGAP